MRLVNRAAKQARMSFDFTRTFESNFAMFLRLFTISMGLAATAFAAETVSSPELRAALEKYRAKTRLEVDFHQVKTIADMDLKLTSSGHLSVQRPNRVEWKVTRPEVMTVVLENEKIAVTADGKTEEFDAKQAASGKDRKSFQELLAWLKLDADILLNKYEITKLGVGRYRFQPRDKDATLKDLEMTLARAGHVEKLSFVEASGDHIEISFGKPK
ncbi:MAG TPA: outer membrane lipoprotein carrier protein LolA [Bdellovibrionales bacterium]|nr:outer membrane lipoprotein carrier protein LolA [Bdellovibrionales bacterium]